MNKPILFSLYLLTCSVYADDSDIKELMTLSLEELMQIPVTGATLTDESLKTVPSAVTVFNRTQIEHLGLDYLHELLDLLPGYQTQRDAETPTLYSYSARGRRNGSQSKEVLVLLDGRIFNDPRSSAANTLMLNLAQIERVEAIRGPGSALYGSGAYTGIINVITRQNTNEVKLAVGSFNRLNGHVLWSKKGDDWQFDVYVQADQDQGQSYNVDDNFNPDPAVRFDTRDPRKKADIDVAWHYRDTLLRGSHRQKQTKDFYTVETLSNGFNRSFYGLTQMSLEHRIHWFDAVQSHLILDWGYTDQNYETQALASGALAAISRPSSTAPLLGKISQIGQYWHFKWHNDWQLGKRQSVQLGLEWLHNQETEAKADNNFDIGQLVAKRFPINYYGNFEHSTPIGTLDSRWVVGVYGQYLQTFATDTSITLGLRYDDYPGIGTHVSPRVGVVHPLTDNQTVKLLYGEAFRAPSLNETGLQNNPVILGNPNLKHEVVKTWDVIWMTQMTRSNLSLDWFFNRYEHPISTQIVGGNIRRFENVNSSEAQGWELETSYQFNSNWLGRGTFTYFSKLPDTAFREADTLASLSINYDKATWDWNLTGVYQGERKMLTGNTTQTFDGHWVFSTKWRYYFDENWLTYLQIKNVLDEDYQTATQGNRLTEGIPNRRREWAVGMEYRF